MSPRFLSPRHGRWAGTHKANPVLKCAGRAAADRSPSRFARVASAVESRSVRPHGVQGAAVNLLLSARPLLEAQRRDRVRTWAQPSPLGHDWQALCVDQGTARQRGLATTPCTPCGRTDRLCTARATRANLKGERSTAAAAARRRISGLGWPCGCQTLNSATKTTRTARAAGQENRGDTRPPRGGQVRAAHAPQSSP